MCLQTPHTHDVSYAVLYESANKQLRLHKNAIVHVINRRHYCRKQRVRQHFNVQRATETVTNSTSVEPRAHKQQRIFSGQLDVDKTQCKIIKTLYGGGAPTCVQVTLQGPSNVCQGCCLPVRHHHGGESRVSAVYRMFKTPMCCKPSITI